MPVNTNYRLLNNHILFGELKKALANNSRYRSLYSASNSWLKDNINKLLTKNKRISNITPYSFVNNSPNSATVEPGSIYMFLYDAKTKDRLKYWDKFPIVLYLQPAPGGFYGLNFHYLPPMLRASIFDDLLSVFNLGQISRTSKLNITYNIITSTLANKQEILKFCLKHYLISHIRSNVILIEPTDWKLALFLPFETFQGASAGQVWQDSARR